MDLNLDDFDVETGANQGVEVRLKDRHGKPTEQYITVQGADSEAYRAALLNQQRRWQKAFNRRGNFTRTPEELETDAIELLAAVSTGWRGFKTRSGEAAEFSRQAVTAVYRQRVIVRTQIDEVVGERANFLPASSTG